MALMHGVELLKVHMHDWIMLFFLGVLAGVLHMISPFHRFVGETMLDDLMYPYKENTVPTWSLPILALVVPLIIFFIYYYWRGDLHDLHHAILGLLFSVFITCVITQVVKDAVGRPRPDFFWRCFPDGIPIFNNVTGNVLCHGDSKIIKEGYKSFPSGHTSASFSGLGFLSLYLAAKIQMFDRRGHIAKITIVLLPLLVATLVGVSRVDDYWHHWQDVFAGAFLGLTMATLCYGQFFPSPSESDVPFGYLQLLTGANANELESKAEENLENGVYYRLEGQSVEESVPIEIIEENKPNA